MIVLLVIAGCDGDHPTTPTTPTGDTGDGSLVDPLSMPARPTLDPADFADAAQCGSCHPDHLAEWRTSNHAYAMIDPVFRGLVAQRQIDRSGREDRFCVQCHSAIGTRGGEVVPGFSFDELSPIALEGVTCTACHTAVSLERPYNSGHVLDPSAPLQGPIDDPVDNPFHASAGNPMFAESAFCGGCHDVVEADGLPLERPYAEWLASPARAEGQQCADCHLPEVERRAAVDGPVRTGHEHRFTGVDVPLADGFLDPAQESENAARTAALLAEAADLVLAAPTAVSDGETFDVTVTLENRIQAHNLPTGSTFLRQVWVELVVTDSVGQVLYETGTLDAAGDLRDRWSELDPYGDEDLISLSSNLVDGLGHPTLFPWTADELTSGALSPGYVRTWTLFVPTSEAAPGPLTVSARLRFRPLPPYLLRLLGLGDRVDRLPVHDLAADALEVGRR